ncbi:hypothetical protein GCM10010922_03120 [Microbacterium sorbitolivorans]|nr:hypothetical protein GCM10010922_03120 [Microbacterium sorbitolivorans]
MDEYNPNQATLPSAFTSAPPPLPPVQMMRTESTLDYEPSVLKEVTTDEILTATAPKGTRAVIYLRVSSKGQVNTDYDPEGISIPAQRIACEKKAQQLGLNVIAEYIEPGRSGTEMTKRISFQQMLARIRAQRDVDYVIVHKLSRFARNRVDDALVMADLQKQGVSLISATESVDATPVGQLMHGILAAFNEYRSREDGADIAYKMGQKAKNGGTLGRAPIGYLNVTENIEGRKVNTVKVDPERAPFVQLAFKLFAENKMSVQDIADELTERGLTTRPTQRRPAGPISDSKLQSMFRDRYYLGEVKYQGEYLPGRHEPIIDEDLFEEVQAVLKTRTSARERHRVHTHYLKGTLWCGHCRVERGVNRRLIQQRSVNRHGEEYWYFFCRGVQDGTCDAPYVSVTNIEAALEAHYGTIQLSEEFIDGVGNVLTESINDQHETEALRRQQLTANLESLKAKEDNLIDLAADGTLPQERIRIRLREIARDREKLQDQLNTATADLLAGKSYIEAMMKLLTDVKELYLNSTDEIRRELNQAIFNNVYVIADDIIGDDIKTPLRDLLAAQRGVAAHNDGLPLEEAVEAAQAELARHTAQNKTGTTISSDPGNELQSELTFSLLNRIYGVEGSSKTLMVDPGGLEPPTPCMPCRCATSCAMGPNQIRSPNRRAKSWTQGDSNPRPPACHAGALPAAPWARFVMRCPRRQLI